MNNLLEIRVPDIGDFKNIPVIEVLVKPGDRINEEDPIITLESDKATMEVPTPAAGIVRELNVKTGDRVSEGSLILRLEAVAAGVGTPAEAIAATEIAGKPAPTPPPTAGAPVAAPGQFPVGASSGAKAASAASPAPYSAPVDLECELLVLGAGPGGYSAAFRAADLGMNVILVERYPTLGGVCLNVGCIPSKALLHVAAVMDEASHLADHGISFGKPEVDLARLRAWKSKVVGKLTTGLTGMAKARKVSVVQGLGRFVDPNHVAVDLTDGGGARKVIRFDKAIIAAGSQAVKLPFLPEDPRLVDSTGALELPFVPKRMLVIGGGIIGLEMATVYSTLGTRLDVVEMTEGLMPGTDRDLVRVWEKINAKRFDTVLLNTRAVRVEPRPDGIHVWFAGDKAPAEAQRYDLVLVSAGRTPNGRNIDADKAGVTVSERGFIPVDGQMRTNVGHIFAIGDIVGQPMLAHKAVHEGHVAAEAAAGQKSFFDAKVIPSVAYTDPEIAWVGLTEEQCKAQGVKYSKGQFPWAASGRAIANSRDEGFTKLLFDEETHRVISGGIVGTHAGDLIGEVALAIEMGCDAVDIGKTIHPHPTLCESVGMAAEVAEGVCTDLMPARKR